MFGVSNLPFEPETIESMRARYSRAMLEQFDVLTTIDDDLRPADSRDNCFDFPCGMRLVVTIDVYPGNVWMLNLGASAGPSPRGLIMELVRRQNPEDFDQHAMRHFREISNDKEGWFDLGTSEIDIRHWARLLAGKLSVDMTEEIVRQCRMREARISSRTTQQETA